MLREDFHRQREEDLRKKAEAEKQRQAQAKGGVGKGPPRKRGPIPKSPAREWLATAAWTAAGPQAIGLFCTLSLLADSRSQHLQIGQAKLGKLLGCSPDSIARWARQLKGLGMIRSEAHRQSHGGRVSMRWQVWILRPAKAGAGAALPGMDDALHGCGPGKNGGEERAPGGRP